MSKSILLVIILFNVLCPLTKGQSTGKLVEIDSCNYKLIVTINANTGKADSIVKKLPYRVFRLVQADVDNDGNDEIILGVNKITVLDSTLRNRINIWRIKNNRLVPMWLGSFFPHPLFDFNIKVKEKKVSVYTIEYESPAMFLVSEYQWHSFGLKFIRYITKHIPLNEAKTIINNPYEMSMIGKHQTK